MNFNLPKVTRRRAGKASWRTESILSHPLLFVKCARAVFSSFFALFCRVFHRPRKRRRGRTESGREMHAAKKNLLFFVGFRASAVGGRPPSPEPARRPFLLCRGRPPGVRTACPHVSPPVKQRTKKGDAAASPSRWFDSASGSYRTSGRGFSRRKSAPGIRFSCATRYSAAGTMRSGYGSSVFWLPSGQIMSRTYPSSPNVTGISTVRVS